MMIKIKPTHEDDDDQSKLFVDHLPPLSLSAPAMLNLTFFYTKHFTRRRDGTGQGSGEKFLIHAGTLYEKTTRRRRPSLHLGPSLRRSPLTLKRCWDEIDLDGGSVVSLLWIVSNLYLKRCTTGHGNDLPMAWFRNGHQVSSHLALRIGLMKERVKVYALDTSLLLSLWLRATAHSFGGRKQIKIPSNIKFPDELIPKVHTECLEWTSFDWILNQTVTQLTRQLIRRWNSNHREMLLQEVYPFPFPFLSIALQSCEKPSLKDRQHSWTPISYSLDILFLPFQLFYLETTPTHCKLIALIALHTSCCCCCVNIRNYSNIFYPDSGTLFVPSSYHTSLSECTERYHSSDSLGWVFFSQLLLLLQFPSHLHKSHQHLFARNFWTPYLELILTAIALNH